MEGALQIIQKYYVVCQTLIWDEMFVVIAALQEKGLLSDNAQWM